MEYYKNDPELNAEINAIVAAELAALREQVERLRERVKAAEYVLKQARPESGYWDTYAKEALK